MQAQPVAAPHRIAISQAPPQMPLSSALQGLLLLRSDSSWKKDPASSSAKFPAAGPVPAEVSGTSEQTASRKASTQRGEHESDSGSSTDGSASTNPEQRPPSQPRAPGMHSTGPQYAEMPTELAYLPHPMAMMPPHHFPMAQHYMHMHHPMIHYEALQPMARKRMADGTASREDEPHLARGRYYPPHVPEMAYEMYGMPPLARYAQDLMPRPMPVPHAHGSGSKHQTTETSQYSIEMPGDADGGEPLLAQDLSDDNLDARIQNLQKLPPQVVTVLEAKLQSFPGWDSRITRTKLNLLGGEVLPDSSPLLAEGERAEAVNGYDPKKFHILCTKCGKHFAGKNALRTFELHAIFWELYSSHPSFSRLTSDRDHRAMYPCNSLSRDVVVFMEAKRPCLCNNQKKIWRLQGNLHHDVSLFQGRGWIQAGSDGSTNVPDKTSVECVLCCRAGKLLEQYDTLRMHVYTWHDSGVFTSCTSCRRIYQNTRAFLSHGCMRKGSDEEERVLAQCAQHMTTLLDTSPEFAMWFFKMRKLSSGRRDEVFDRVSKRLRITSP